MSIKKYLGRLYSIDYNSEEGIAEWKRIVDENTRMKKLRLKRAVESGMRLGRTTPKGEIIDMGEPIPQAFQGNFWDTKTCIEWIEKRIAEFGSCRINDRWCLQLRGKNLRRVLKKRPNWEQRGRKIVEK